MTSHADDNLGAGSPDKPAQLPPEEQKPSGDQPVINVYTDADVERITAEKHSKLRKEIAGYEKQVAGMTSLQQQLSEAQVALATANREREAREYESVKDTPDALKAWERSKELATKEATLKEQEAKLTRDREEHATLFQAAEKVSLLTRAQEIAKEKGIDPDLLTDQQTPEQMEALAAKLAKKYGVPQTPDLVVDSGVGSGAGVDFNKMTAEQKVLWGIAHPKKKTS